MVLWLCKRMKILYGHVDSIEKDRKRLDRNACPLYIIPQAILVEWKKAPYKLSKDQNEMVLKSKHQFTS